MNGHNKVDQPSAEKRTSNETAIGAKIEDIITIVSHLHSETQLHNPIAAYFLEMCRFSLLNPDLKLESDVPVIVEIGGAALPALSL